MFHIIYKIICHISIHVSQNVTEVLSSLVTVSVKSESPRTQMKKTRRWKSIRFGVGEGSTYVLVLMKLITLTQFGFSFQKWSSLIFRNLNLRLVHPWKLSILVFVCLNVLQLCRFSCIGYHLNQSVSLNFFQFMTSMRRHDDVMVTLL